MTQKLIFINIQTMMVDYDGGKRMAKCPKCGGEAREKRKPWTMAGRPDKKGMKTELTIGLYECPKCGTFRKVLSKRKIRA